VLLPQPTSHRDVPTPSRSSQLRCWPTRQALATGQSPPTSTCPSTRSGPGCVALLLEPSGYDTERPCGPTSATPTCRRSHRPGPDSVMPWKRSVSRSQHPAADWAPAPLLGSSSRWSPAAESSPRSRQPLQAEQRVARRTRTPSS